MHKKTLDALNPAPSPRLPSPAPAVKFPVPPRLAIEIRLPVRLALFPRSRDPSRRSRSSTLNYMFPDLSQKPAENQTSKLPTSREESTIPRVRATATGSTRRRSRCTMRFCARLLCMTYGRRVDGAVHNFLNEGAWGEILGWRRRFGQGLYRGGRFASAESTMWAGAGAPVEWHRGGAQSVRFQGRPRT